MGNTLIIFEFVDEVESFASIYGLDRLKGRNCHILAFQPEVQAYLKRRNINYFNTTMFFDKDSHEKLILKSHDIVTSFRRLLNITDDLGIKEGYNNIFIFYIRFFIHHLLWLVEIIDRAVNQLEVETLISFYQDTYTYKRLSISSLSIPKSERYLGIICKMFSEIRGIKFEPFLIKKNPHFINSALKDKFSEFIEFIIYRLSYILFFGVLRGRRFILAPSASYNMGRVVDELAESFDAPLTVYLSVNNRSTDIRRMFRFDRYWSLIFVSGRLNRKQKNFFLKRLNSEISMLEEYISKPYHLLRYKGIDLNNLVLHKIKKAMVPFLFKLYGQSRCLNNFLKKSRPALIVSQMARGLTYNLGELARIHNIPAVLISHGSHVPPSNQYDGIEWKEHGLGLMNTHYQYIDIQSPWAMKYLEKVTTNSQSIVTGPLLLTKIKRNSDERISLRRKIIPQFANKVIILHAGSPKGRRGTRFYVYETLDEYIKNINSLIRAIESIDGVHLIIRFRPSEYITKEDFVDLLVKFNCYSIHSEGSFADYLQMSDLLVSYSSTTIEEALQSNVPVLQYDPQGKYCHIKGEILKPELKPKVDSCYFVDSDKNLGWGIKWIIENHLSKEIPESIWERHAFNEREVVPLTSYFGNIFGTK